jgi:hypothetical protein
LKKLLSKSEPSSRNVKGSTVLSGKPQQQNLAIDMSKGRSAQRSTDEYLDSWNAKLDVKNKENIPEKNTAKQKRFIDPQPNARALEWDENFLDGEPGPSEQPEPSGRKRPHESEDDEESDQSDDQGFQADRRPPDPRKREAASSKRARIESEGEDEEAEVRRQNRVRAEAALQASARDQEADDDAADDEVDDDNDDENDDESQAPPATQAKAIARIKTAIAKPERIQVRKPWSPRDEAHLEELIAEHGCKWSIIEKNGHFEREVNQGALKDKARNLKVAYLK